MQHAVRSESNEFPLRKRKSLSAWGAALGVAALVIAGGGWFAYAATGVPGTAETLPFRGHIEQGGAFVASARLRFTIYHGNSAATALSSGWSEIHTVTPVNGDFTVLLGSANPSGNPLTDAVLRPATGVAFIGVDVVDGSGAVLAALGGKQLLASAPYARGGSPGANFIVDGNLGVGVSAPTTKLDVNGGARLNGAATINGTATIAGNTTVGNIGAQTGELSVGANVWSRNTWEPIATIPLTTAADVTFSCTARCPAAGGPACARCGAGGTFLDGNADGRYRFVLRGKINAGGANRAIGVRPNGATSNYTAIGQHWVGHDPGVTYHNTASNTGFALSYALLPICTSHWSSNGWLSCVGELDAAVVEGATTMPAIMRSEDVFVRELAPNNDVLATTHLSAWWGANITSATLYFNGAPDFDGTVTVFRMRAM